MEMPNRLRHPGWLGVVLPLILTAIGTFSPSTIRPILLGVAVLAAIWTFYRTEYAGQKSVKTVVAAAIFLIIGIAMFFAGRKHDAHDKEIQLVSSATSKPPEQQKPSQPEQDPEPAVKPIPKAKAPKGTKVVKSGPPDAIAQPPPKIQESGGIAQSPTTASNPQSQGTAVIVHGNGQWISRDDTILGAENALRIEEQGKVDSQRLKIIAPGQADVQVEPEQIDAFIAEADKIKDSEISDWTMRIANYLRLNYISPVPFLMQSSLKDKKQWLRDFRAKLL